MVPIIWRNLARFGDAIGVNTSEVEDQIGGDIRIF